VRIYRGCSVENTNERPGEGQASHDKQSGWRRDGGVGKLEVIEGMVGFRMIAGVGWLSFDELVLEWTGEEAFGLVRMEGRDFERV